MLKKIAFLILGLLLLVYLGFSIFFLNPKAGKGQICNDLQIQIVDTLERHYLTNEDVNALLKQASISPIGKHMDSINIDEIKEKLTENRLIKKVDCFKTVGGTIRIKIYQRIPILRVFSGDKSYYVDNKGEIMPVPRNFAAYVPVASGYINEEYAKEKLHPFAVFLQNDKFWNSQIEQIFITSCQDVELTPRVGKHRIILGQMDAYKENLQKLRFFYDKGLDKVGWNKYSVINLKYKNQVVCTKSNS